MTSQPRCEQCGSPAEYLVKHLHLPEDHGPHPEWVNGYTVDLCPTHADERVHQAGASIMGYWPHEG